jgi:hypothetical protein
MSLHDAVTAVAEGMDERADRWEKIDHLNEQAAAEVLRGFARELRIAIKAAGPSRATPPLAPGIGSEESLDATVRANLEKDRAERARRKAEAKEGLDSFAELIGGPEDEPEAGMTTAPVDPDMPVGAFAQVGDRVYQYRKDKKLHYHPEETARLRERLKQRRGS